MCGQELEPRAASLSLLSATDPSPGGPSSSEERVAQEALEALQLEKRLSLLSHSGRLGSGGRAGGQPGLGCSKLSSSPGSGSALSV